jgi:hypothetical protein
MSKLQIPAGYAPLLNLKQTELGIKSIKDFFQANLSSDCAFVVSPHLFSWRAGPVSMTT